MGNIKGSLRFIKSEPASREDAECEAFKPPKFIFFKPRCARKKSFKELKGKFKDVMISECNELIIF